MATCMYVTITECAPGIGRYKLNVLAGLQTFLMARYNYMYFSINYIKSLTIKLVILTGYSLQCNMYKLHFM